ncbi:RNA polymerase sigma factor [Sphingomonas koreensis]
MTLPSRSVERAAAIPEGDPLPPNDLIVPGEAARVDLLYREHRPRLLRMLRRFTSNDNAGDLVQQLFARFTALGPIRQAAIDNIAGYLHRSAVNLALDEAKRERRRAAGDHVSAETVELRAPDQIAALEARDTLRRLETALARLKPRTREIFLAHRVDGLSYVEIAARTGLSVKGVEKHMSRAIALVDRVLPDR